MSWEQDLRDRVGPSPAPGLIPPLERALLRALARDWSQLNQERFRGALRSPSFSLSGRTGERGKNLGTWSTIGRTLNLDRDFVMRSPWTVVREVLLHEMAHQFVDEVYASPDGRPAVRDEGPHGPTFTSVCERFGIDPRASGTPQGGAEGAADATSRVVERVRKLLALATSSNQHEAESAMNAAQALLLRYNLDAAGAGGSRVEVRTLGLAATRHSEEEKVLASILTRHFFVRGIWINVFLQDRGVWGRVFEISGTPENVEMAAYVHAFLQETTRRLWEQHGFGHTRTALARFRAGAYQAFYYKLGEQAHKHAETGLVWVGDATVDASFERRHPRTRKFRAAGFTRDLDFHTGREVGRDIVLNRPIGGSAGNRQLQIEKKR